MCILTLFISIRWSDIISSAGGSFSEGCWPVSAAHVQRGEGDWRRQAADGGWRRHVAKLALRLGASFIAALSLRCLYRCLV